MPTRLSSAPIIAALSAGGAPAALGAAIRLLFRTPRRFRSAADLATASGLAGAG